MHDCTLFMACTVCSMGNPICFECSVVLAGWLCSLWGGYDVLWLHYIQAGERTETVCMLPKPEVGTRPLPELFPKANHAN